MSSLLNRLRNEPALVIGTLVAVIIFAAQQFNVLLDEDSLTQVLTPIVTAILVRSKVSPASKAVKTGSTLTVRDSEGTASLVIDADVPAPTPSLKQIAQAKEELGL